MAKANTKKLDALHDAIATYYGEAISDALEDGAELSSGTLAAVNAFLKNNNVTADVMESSPMQNMTYQLKQIIDKEREAN